MKNVPLPADLESYPAVYCAKILLILKRSEVPDEVISEVMDSVRCLSRYAMKKIFAESDASVQEARQEKLRVEKLRVRVVGDPTLRS